MENYDIKLINGETIVSGEGVHFFFIRTGFLPVGKIASFYLINSQVSFTDVYITKNFGEMSPATRLIPKSSILEFILKN